MHDDPFASAMSALDAADRRATEQRRSSSSWTPMDDALDALPARSEEANDWHGAPPAAREAPPRRVFVATPVDDIELGNEPAWLIEGLMPAHGFAAVVGLPKSRKSFVLADALMHVAMGRPWAGRDTLEGAVVYITGEGVRGFKRRLVAMRRHYGVEGAGVPFLLIPVAPDLGKAEGDAPALIAAIRAALNAIGDPPLRAVALDTLARSMYGADENTAGGMTAFADNCGAISSAFDCITIAVHHSGKDESKGPRGSNAFLGALDAAWSVEKNEALSTATVSFMKDAEAGASWQFRLQSRPLEEESAAPLSAAPAVVEMVTEPGSEAAPAAVRSRKLPDRAKLLLGIVQHALGEMGEAVRGDPNVPHTARAISRDDLKKYLPLRGYWDDDVAPSVRRANLSRDLQVLNVRHVIGCTSEWVWLR